MKEKFTITKKSKQTSVYLYTYYPQYTYINLNFGKSNYNHHYYIEYKKFRNTQIYKYKLTVSTFNISSFFVEVNIILLLPPVVLSSIPSVVIIGDVLLVVKFGVDNLLMSLESESLCCDMSAAMASMLSALIAVVLVSPHIHLHLHPSGSLKCTVAEDGERESLYKTLATFPETAS